LFAYLNDICRLHNYSIPLAHYKDGRKGIFNYTPYQLDLLYEEGIRMESHKNKILFNMLRSSGFDQKARDELFNRL